MLRKFWKKIKSEKNKRACMKVDGYKEKQESVPSSFILLPLKFMSYFPQFWSKGTGNLKMNVRINKLARPTTRNKYTC